ncbi:MAG: hypothetical protein IBX64_12255 [Actinobacteria bacterium]|nr:hypothetical protein [Actinomycetota bacterium]
MRRSLDQSIENEKPVVVAAAKKAASKMRVDINQTERTELDRRAGREEIEQASSTNRPGVDISIGSNNGHAKR